MKKFAIVALLGSISLFVNGMHPLVRNFNRKISNAGTQSWDIIQYKNDWLYFANNNGLLEFDGLKWTTYPIRNYTNVRSLYYDTLSGRIYAGAFNEFGYYERNKQGILKYNSISEKLKPDDKKFNEIWKIHKTGTSFYFQGDFEIFKVENNKTKRFPLKNKINSSAVVYNSLIISDSENGAMFLNGDLFMQLPNCELLKGKKICTILPFGDHQILFVSDLNGLFLFNGEKVVPYKTDIDNFLSDNQVFCAGISNNKLAIGTVRGGLVVKDMQNNTNIFSNTFTGLQNNTILSLNFDRNGNLWLGLDKGIDYVMINSPVYDLFGNNSIYGAGYAAASYKNHLYLGTNQGLYLSSLPISTSNQPLSVALVPKIKGQVWVLKTIEDHLFCGSDKGAFLISENKAEQISGISGTWNFEKLETHPNTILGCSYQGFFTLKNSGKGWSLHSIIKGFDESGGMFLEDNDGKIWFSHWMKGIYRLTLNQNADSITKVEYLGSENGFPTRENNSISKVNGQIVFSTVTGFYTFNNKTNKIEPNQLLNKLFGTPRFSKRILETPNGNLWCYSISEIMVAVKQKDNSYKVDSTSFGTLKNKLISGFDYLGYIDNSNLIAGTEDGFSWLDIKNLHSNNNRIKLTVSKVYSTNERDSLISGYLSGLNNDVIPQFDSKHNSIRFEFVGSEFRGENAIQYSYFLENYDSEWSQYSYVNTKEYTRLAKGTYTFRVKAKNMFDSEIVETEYKFTILPPWYQSSTAYIIYLTLLIAMFFLLIKYISYRSEKGAREMEARKEMEMQEQEKRFKADAKEKEKEIIALKNQKLQYELRHKSQDLASSTMNLIRKNEMLLDINTHLDKIGYEIAEKSEPTQLVKKIRKIQEDIKQNIEHDNNWKKFQENFDLVYENYLKRLGEQFPALTVSDKKLCAYLKMDLSSKEIAPLLNMSFRSVEMSRYRLRKKLNLDREINLTEFLQNF